MVAKKGGGRGGAGLVMSFHAQFLCTKFARHYTFSAPEDNSRFAFILKSRSSFTDFHASALTPLNQYLFPQVNVR